jgi:hypothetical protein
MPERRGKMEIYTDCYFSKYIYVPSPPDQEDGPLSPDSRGLSPSHFRAHVKERIAQVTEPLERSLLLSLTDIIRDARDATLREYHDLTEGDNLTPIQSYALMEPMEPPTSRPTEAPLQASRREQDQNFKTSSLEAISQPFLAQNEDS